MNLNEILLTIMAVGIWAIVFVLAYGLFGVGPNDNQDNRGDF